MKDDDKGPGNSANEEVILRRRIAELEAAEIPLKRSKTELVAANWTLWALLQASPLAIIAVNPEGNITVWNPAAERMFGWSKEEVADRPNPLFPADRRKEFRELRERTLRGETFSDVEARRETKDGSLIDVSFSTAPLRNAQGNIVGTMAIIADITERKKTAELLKEGQDQLQRTFEKTVHALATAVEQRDPYTAGHQKRVARLACAMAKEMGLSEHTIQGIHLAAVIHDIGKLHVPAEILTKPGRLSEIEFSLIKNHPQDGYDILAGIEFPWPVAQIVRQHHERMDGSGYPLGLSGGDIVIEARIVGVADVVEAMASHRPYRPSRGVENALLEITAQKGMRYDAGAVDACILLLNNGFNIEADR
jgi:PAS domain S-box-containing protein/putative nucleotidyltransferase with HDIG domain